MAAVVATACLIGQPPARLEPACAFRHIWAHL
jgi:hypothetical protein